MLTYEIKSIPDLTLSKYQVFADSGVDGMLEAQTQFIRQLHRVALLGNVSIHIVFDYDPDRSSGNKLRIRLIFKNATLNGYKDKLRKIVRASGISSYFSFKEVDEKENAPQLYSHMAVMRKKERFLQTVVNNEERYFYVVPNWEISDDARLYGLLKMMQSFDEKCVYRVDLYTEDGIADRIHRNFEKPLTYLRNISSQERGISELSKMHREKRDLNADETLTQYEEWLKAIDTSPAFLCRICALTNDDHYGQLLLDSAISECLETGDGSITTEKGLFSPEALMDELPVYCSDEAPKSMQRWATTFTVDEIAAFSRLPVLYDGESIELPKETAAKHETSGMIIGYDTNGYDVMIPQKLLPKHMFVCGVPGSGKTNTMLHLANSLWNTEIVEGEAKKKSHIPFLVLEPAKREYREEWLERPVIIELEALGEGPANFVTLLLCTLIRETLKANPLKDRDKPVRHVIFIEEAHNLIAPQSQTADPQDSNPKIAATAFIVKMLAEVRALREGIIIADQLPTAMAPEVIKNTNIKLVHRLTSQDDRELVGSTMSASPLQMENMATYTSGQALITFEKLLRPFEMQVCLVEEHGEETPDDEQLYQMMMQKPAYRALMTREEEEKFQNLKQRVSDALGEEAACCESLKEVNLRKMDTASFEKWLETNVFMLKGLKALGISLSFECMRLSDELLDADRKKALVGYAQAVGQAFEKSLQQAVQYI